MASRPGRLTVILSLIVLLSGCGGSGTLDRSERVQFLDNTAAFKGKTVTMEVEYDGKGRRRGDRLYEIPVVAYTNSGHYEFSIDIPPDIPLPNIEPGHYVVVTFLCTEGERFSGNRAIAVTRP